MSFSDGTSSLVANRLALEALRSGVPNRAAVRLLGLQSAASGGALH